MTPILQCRGWGCDVAPYCEKARYITEAERERQYVREMIPTSPGEHCPEFEIKRKKRWGDGALND